MSQNFFPRKASKIICLLRNYAKHAQELKNPLPGGVVFFLKPPSSILINSPNENKFIEIPSHCNCDHEVELVAVIGKRGRDIQETEALDFVKGYTLALDITARNLQMNAKTNGHPWTESKGYDTFCPISEVLIPKDEIDISKTEIYLKVNGEIRQQGKTSEMIYTVPEIISALSKIMTLEEDDLILTGTPAGVGRLLPGDIVHAGIKDSIEMKFGVVQRETV